MVGDAKLASEALCIYFSCWAVRYKAGLDYKLSRRAQVLRWWLVVIGYSLIHVPGAGAAYVRVAAGFVGLAVFCWPNLAYRLDRLLFRDWPVTRGTVESSEVESEANWKVQYSFEFHGERHGGAACVQAVSGVEVGNKYRAGSTVAIQYDPLNPTQSRIARSLPG